MDLEQVGQKSRNQGSKSDPRVFQCEVGGAGADLREFPSKLVGHKLGVVLCMESVREYMRLFFGGVMELSRK